jgi:hypothetical protein
MVTPMDFLRPNRLPTAVVLTLLTLDFLAVAMVCLWGHGGSRFFPTGLYPFVENGGYDLNGTLLALACSQVTLLTLWVLNGRAAVEIRLGSLILGIAAWFGTLHFFYGDGIRVSSLGALFSGQVVTLFTAVMLLRRRLFPQDQRDFSVRWKKQFSIRTLLLATTLVATGITVAPYLGIVVTNPYASMRSASPLVVNQWRLVLGACCALSAVFSMMATQCNPRKIPFRIALAGLISSFMVVALVWLAVDSHFFYPSFSNLDTSRFAFYDHRHLYQPWVSWIAIQVVIVSSVLLAFRWNRSRELVQCKERAT